MRFHLRIDESYILVCRDLDKIKTYITDNYQNTNIKIFAPDDFLLENAKEVVREAYIAESEQKIIVMISKSFNLIAQNSLLKILEEPPRNITFIMCAPSRMIFLPTVRSRLTIKVLEADVKLQKSGLDFKRMGIGEIYSFIKDKRYMEKNELKSLIQGIMEEICEQDIKLNAHELSFFEKILHLAELNSSSSNLLSCALLAIYHRKNR
ncbi:MAG: DNA polymerase III subunit delta' [Campylobacteraceae bacterium]|jgi:DNA polymerase-3 subunit delta'|nr:DNA polymerase III subunit delta' [Campylobacteraceae bacterium]